MKKRTRLIGLSALLALLGVVGIALAQVSVNFDLGWHVIGNGGGMRESANYRIQDTLGLPVAGASASAHYQIESGFWLVGAGHLPNVKQRRIYLPLVLR